jgi:hypothetical protein
MSNRLGTSWELLKASGGVLRDHPELLLFPVFSTLSLLLLTVGLGVPLVLSGTLEHLQQGPAAIAGTFLYYLVVYFVGFFFNSALVSAAMVRLRGGTPTVRGALAAASARVGNILAYAALAATVGLLLRTLSERAGFVGRIIASLVGGAWGVLTYLAVPVLVSENVGPMDVVRRSKELLAQTWGSGFLLASAGIGLSFFLISLGITVVLCGVLIPLAVYGGPIAVVGVALLGIGWLVMLAMAGATLGGIYRSAVYVYAVDGTLSDRFNPEHLRTAFKLRP